MIRLPRVCDVGHVATWTVVAVLGGGCAAVRPVSLYATVPGPAAYVSEFHPPPSAADDSEAPQADGQGDGASEAQGPDARRPPESARRPTKDGAWWAAFAEPALSAAVQEALLNNYALRNSRTLVIENGLTPSIPKGPLWPLQIGLPANLQHTTLGGPPASGQPAYTTSYNEGDFGVTASYQVDVWGQLDAQRRTAVDAVEQQRQSAEVLAQGLAEQVTELWFEILEQRAMRDLLERQVRYSQGLLSYLRARFDLHLVSRLAVLQQEQQQLDTQAQVPLVLTQLALLNSRLTALLGRVPSPNADVVPDDRRLPDLPPAPDAGTPGDLFHTSPEVRMAQQALSEAEHTKNENLASWLPAINVLGSAGLQSFEFQKPFVTSNVGISLTWPIFDGGQRITRARQIEVVLQRRHWQLEVAFRTALQRVQDALIQEHKQAEHLRTLHAEVDLGRRVLHEARQLFEQGLSDYLPVLTALGNLSSLERSALQAQRLLLSYRIQLYHALGGTWSDAVTRLTN
jgi:outer membrane protein TolC